MKNGITKNPKLGPGKDDSGFYEPYSNFSTRMRNWLAAYGIGAPVLFVSQSEISNALTTSGSGKFVIVLFLIGVLIQVIAAFIYKSAMWYLYIGEHDKKFKNTKRYRYSDTISEIYWPEVVFDLGTITLFSIATYTALSVVVH